MPVHALGTYVHTCPRPACIESGQPLWPCTHTSAAAALTNHALLHAFDVRPVPVVGEQLAAGAGRVVQVIQRLEQRHLRAARSIRRAEAVCCVHTQHERGGGTQGNHSGPGPARDAGDAPQVAYEALLCGLMPCICAQETGQQASGG